MSLARCPACRARLLDEAICPRCSCDLSLVRRAEVQAQQWIARALRAWARGDLAQARACASAALLLEPHPLAKAVLQCLEPQQIGPAPGARWPNELAD